MRDIMTNTRFLLLWSLGSIVSIFGASIVGIIIFFAVAFGIVAIIGENPELITPTQALIVLIVLFSSVGLGLGWVFGSIQKAILRMRTREPWRGWVIASCIGGIIGVDIAATLLIFQGSGYIVYNIIPDIDTLFWFTFQFAITVFGALGAIQMFVLANYVRGSWVWILANMVAGVVFFSLLAFGALSWAATPLIAMVLVFLIAAAPGIVTGFALVWLISTNWRQDY